MAFESDVSFLNSDIDQYLNMFEGECEQKDVIVGADNEPPSTFTDDLFPDLNDCMLGDRSNLLSPSVEKIGIKIPTRKPTTIYKIKLNSTNDLQRILNLANAGFGNKADEHNEDGVVSSSTKSEKVKTHCNSSSGMSKNAVAARENRQKKKKYVETLESSVQRLAAENSNMRSNLSKLKDQVEDYDKEVKYLRTVLANVNEISALIKSVRKTPEINLSTSLEESTSRYGNISKKRKFSHDDEENAKRLKVRSFDKNHGVCLHVAKSKVSLEFCYACSNNARNTQSSCDTDSGTGLEDHDYVDITCD